MAAPIPLALYNPSLLPPDVLLAEFTARRAMLATLLDVIRNNAPGQPPQHALLIGTRGMGKTMTLWAIAHSVARDYELSRRWQPVVFDEESRRVGDLADFWLEAIRQWEHATNNPADRAGQLLDRAGSDIEESARKTFLDLVTRSGRRALLLVDNLNDVFASIHDPEPLHRLRAFLMEDSRLMIVGCATRFFDEVTHIDQPFYDFFRVFELRALTVDEMKECLLALAKSRGDENVPRTLEEREGTVRALHLLTGGNPRLIKTFYRLLADGLRSDIRADLERLLDEFTPYFKAIVDALPVQQQRIFDAVALAWNPVEVGVIARVTRVPSNQVSAQLRSLFKAGLVTEAPSHPKRKAYLLADRFSNIHYLMRHGRAARNRFDWFVALVRLIFPDKETAGALARVARQTAECGTDGLRDARDLIHSALCRAESAEARRQLLHATFRESWDEETFASLSNWLDVAEAKTHMPEAEIVAFFSQMPRELRKKLGYKPDDAGWWFALARQLKEKKAWMLVEAAYRKELELDPNYPLGWAFLGYLLAKDPDRFAEAEVALRKAIEIDGKDAWAWSCLGDLLAQDPNRVSEAEAAFRKAVEVAPNDAWNWTFLGTFLTDYLGRHAEAEAAFWKSIELNPKHFWSWRDLGKLLTNHLNRITDADAAYRNAIQIDPENSSGWQGLAEVCSKQGKTEEARACVVKAVLLDPERNWTRGLFITLCADHIESWKGVLPGVAAWCAANPKNTEVFDFTVDGFLRLARLAKPSEGLAILDALADSTPFETLRDTFRAHADREHLNRLAPERRAIVIELLKRLDTSSQTK
jgi:tetratricopeptide (TPR) repeat protein